jgi:hypothetical protein
MPFPTTTLRGFERAAAQYEAREPDEPIEGDLCGFCAAHGVEVALVDDECARCNAPEEGPEPDDE